jgi:hypothetical protein
MSVYSHVLFVDESGLGGRATGIQSVRSAAGVLVSFNDVLRFDNEVLELRRANFNPSQIEIKGTDIPNELLPGISPASFLSTVVALLDEFDSEVWVSVAREGLPPPTNFPVAGPSAKTIARHGLFEQVSYALDRDPDGVGSWLVVWDFGDTGDLRELNDCLVLFASGAGHPPPNQRLCPSALGGLSHKWGALQIADVIAHFALHRAGKRAGLMGANDTKSALFSTCLWGVLETSGNRGNPQGCGWTEHLRS